MLCLHDACIMLVLSFAFERETTINLKQEKESLINYSQLQFTPILPFVLLSEVSARQPKAAYYGTATTYVGGRVFDTVETVCSCPLVC